MPRATGAGSYRAVLSLPFALRTFVPALGGRLAYGLLPLATLFTIVDATGSYATAGSALALLGLTSIALPAKARLADRFGQRRTLPVLALICAAALAAAVTTHSPIALVTLFGLAGVAAPPLGPAMRATWRVLTVGTTLKERAYGLDSVCEETLYLLGPLLTGLLVALGPARNAVLVTALLLVTGAVGMVLPPPAGRSWSPADRGTRSPRESVSQSPARVSQSAGGLVGPSDVAAGSGPPDGGNGAAPAAVSAAACVDETAPPEPRRRGSGPLRAPGLWPVLAVLLVAGAGVSVAYTAAAAVAQHHGRPGAAGWLEAAAALGGVTGGLLWARRRHQHGRAAHLAGLLTAQAVAVLLSAAAGGSLPGLALIMAVGGAAVSPIYVVAYLAADDLAPDGRGTEAGTWVNVAANAGSAAGSAAAGLLVQSSGPASAFLTAGLVLAVSALVMAGLAVERGGGSRVRPRPHHWRSTSSG
jgi:predicted MFS family arabinose efflux permease